MSTAIKREDIRKGDRVRRVEVTEFNATSDIVPSRFDNATYELIERPVVLPPRTGSVVIFDRYQEGELTGGCAVRTGGSGWLIAGQAGHVGNGKIASMTGVQVLRPEAEVAAEVLASVEEMLGYDIDPGNIVAAKFGATL